MTGADQGDEEFEPCGPMQRIWSTKRNGGLEVWAEHDPNGGVWWLWMDEARATPIGEAESIDNPEEWAFDTLEELGLVDWSKPQLP